MEPTCRKCGETKQHLDEPFVGPVEDLCRFCLTGIPPGIRRRQMRHSAQVQALTELTATFRLHGHSLTCTGVNPWDFVEWNKTLLLILADLKGHA